MKKLIVFSSPSGGGKSSIVKMLLKKYKSFILSTSATTRSPRKNEVDGVHYYFKNQAYFKTMIDTDQLIEWEEIFGNYYGTPKSELERVEDKDKCLIFDIDVKGAVSIKEKYPNDSILIFIAPPSTEELLRRLKMRNTETDEQIQIRLERANYEMTFQDEFDYVVINENLNKAFSDVEEILRSNTDCAN